MQKRKIYFFIGTTAELIKISPIIREFKKRKIKFKLITSGQNRVFFEQLEGFTGPLKADIEFKIKGNKSSIFLFILWALRTLFFSLINLRKEFKNLNKSNSYLIIQGDTVSSSIGAVIAKVYNLKLVLIECGDLSFNLLEPFPEEICRNINIHLADILFPPNKWAESNLKGLKGIIINTKYNTLIESFWWAMKTKTISQNIKKFKNYYILILHRQEHVIFRKEWSKSILEFIINNANQKLKCIVLNHPLTVSIIQSLKLDSRNSKIKIISPVPYTDFMKLINGAEFIASDSAFNQLEAYLMGKPYLALRDLTEQIEGLNKNVVLSKSNEDIMKDFLLNYTKYKTKPIPLKEKPSKTIADYLISH